MKRIIGTFTKQQWINDFAERIGEEKFDATDRVLRLELSELHELDDSDATTG